MPVHHLRPRDYRVMPWKNGMGTTTEIAAAPLPTVLGEGFAWRLSIADVAADGPFSKFPHIDRQIMVIDGGGMMLAAGAQGIFDLSQPFVPVAFAGEWPVDGRLLDGPVKDFNVMADRRVARADLQVLAGDCTVALLPDAHTVLLYLFADAAVRLPDGTSTNALAQDCLIMAPGQNELAVTSTGRAALVQISLSA